MRITEKNTQNYDFRLLQDAMSECNAGLNLSQNPLLPDLIAKIMGWPVLKLLFFAGKKPVAWFAALYTGKEWFSLPHFNSGAYWFDEAGLSEWLKYSNLTLTANAQQFYASMVGNQLCFSDTATPDRLLILKLEPDDFSIGLVHESAAVKIKMRSYLPLDNFRYAHKTDSLLSLSSTPDAQWKMLSGNVRRKIGKAGRNGICIYTGGVELLDLFYNVYRHNIHQLGSFGLPIRFFSTLLQEYSGGKAMIVIAEYKGEPVGSAILLTWLHFAENPWFATLRSTNHYYVSYLLHWEMMKQALAAECHLYSFGRSTHGSGVHLYKQQWGTIGRTIYLNCNHPMDDHLGKKEYIRSLIRQLPESLTRLFDHYVACKYY